MKDDPPATLSAPLLSPAMTLREACHRTGQDDDGRRCLFCPMLELCDSEDRWLVQLVARPRYN